MVMELDGDMKTETKRYKDTSSSSVTGVAGSRRMADSYLLLKLSKIKSR